jgi:hypothetical protein
MSGIHLALLGMSFGPLGLQPGDVYEGGFLPVKFQRQAPALRITTLLLRLSRPVKIPASNGKRQTLQRREQLFSY